MILFQDWSIQADQQLIGRQHDHLTRTLLVCGDLPKGWDWTMIVQVGEHMDYLPLTPLDGGMGIVLTAHQLSLSGHYTLQLRGVSGEQVKHTNSIVVYIPPTLSGDAHWSELPSSFSALETRIRDYALHPPTVGQNGNWWVWDGSTYTDTNYSAVDEMLAALPNADEVTY